eukprot:CAMPEP_0113533784 /NCGR_PEP_ID=MMETSP0015_2-20120614/4801_1 /TAXON_ID=2838 /ORGANISM="Odontella" /LENGTH=407 /DNA_ID=CAMNT_0000432883 /DNA_START=113 /DNA_END=1336 /DNA_ORIENTATION=- /assembly_acc=CAM_ASM_000160
MPPINQPINQSTPSSPSSMDMDIPIATATPVPYVPSSKVLQPCPRVEAAGGELRSPSDITSEQISLLKEQGFTEGLARSLAASMAAFPLRIWVVDNSGSMAAVDGHRFVETSKRNEVKVVSCTRWSEIQETVEYHARLAALLKAPTIFRMLNNPGSGVGQPQFGIADKGDSFIDQDLQLVLQIIQKSCPGGVTPLARHVREIREQVTGLASALNQRGQKVAIILATDGLPTDDNGVCNEYYKRDFVDAIRGVEGLPVWVVVRLCTDDEEVVDFYNDLDAQLELSVEVLDDFVGESDEVHGHNRWLNYALPLHRCREMGFHHRIMDLLDERRLTAGELAEFCRLLFGEGQFDGAPDPEADFKGFLTVLKRALNAETQQYNPVKTRMLPWVDVEKIRKDFGRKQRWLIK